MKTDRRLRLAIAAAFALGSAGWLAGCGSGGGDADVSKPLSPENEKMTRDMLKNYGKQMADQAKAQRAGKRP